MNTNGTLYLIPTFLSEDNPDILTTDGKKLLYQLDGFIVENEKTARRFLKLIKSPVSQPTFKFHLLNEHTKDIEISAFLQPLKEGKNVGLMSEAGCPGVADPGSEVVRLAHLSGIKVVPLIGPSSILLALMSSGMNGQSFVFHGYLPRESESRKQKIKELEKDALKKKQTQLFIETPYRNNAMLQDLLLCCAAETQLCIACNLTGKEESIETKSIGQWKKKQPDLNKKPCIFLLGK